MLFVYVDDSGTRDKKNPYQVMAAVIVSDEFVHFLEVRTALMVEDIIPPDRVDELEELHACDLYYGYGVFEGVPKELRFKTMTSLLRGVSLTGASIVYASAKKEQFGNSTDPIDLCFRSCVMGIHDRIKHIKPAQVALLIVDEMDKDLKKLLRGSFREHRQPLKGVIFPTTSQWRFHDAMYFGSSAESVGLQTADLCAFFIAKHLQGNEPEAEDFYKMIHDRIAYKVNHDVPPRTKAVPS